MEIGDVFLTRQNVGRFFFISQAELIENTVYDQNWNCLVQGPTQEYDVY